MVIPLLSEYSQVLMCNRISWQLSQAVPICVAGSADLSNYWVPKEAVSSECYK